MTKRQRQKVYKERLQRAHHQTSISSSEEEDSIPDLLKALCLDDQATNFTPRPIIRSTEAANSNANPYAANEIYHPSDPLSPEPSAVESYHHCLPSEIWYLILSEMPDQPALYALLRAFPSLKPLWRERYGDIHERIYGRAAILGREDGKEKGCVGGECGRVRRKDWWTDG